MHPREIDAAILWSVAYLIKIEQSRVNFSTCILPHPNALFRSLIYIRKLNCSWHHCFKGLFYLWLLVIMKLLWWGSLLKEAAYTTFFVQCLVSWFFFLSIHTAMSEIAPKYCNIWAREHLFVVVSETIDYLQNVHSTTGEYP